MSLFGFIDNKIDFWLLLGQSNMVGAAPQAQFPAAYTGFQYGNISQSVTPLVYSSGDWGVRYILMKDLADYYSKQQYHILGAVSGTRLGYDPVGADWNILSTAAHGSGKILAQRLLDNAIALADQAFIDIAAKGVDYVFKGVLWAQGASDMLTESYANAYAQNLKDVRDFIRNYYSLPTLPFFISQTHNNWDPVRAYSDIVRQAQLDCSNQSTNPTFYDAYSPIDTNTNSYELMPDFAHYDGPGTIQAAAGWKTIIKTIYP